MDDGSRHRLAELVSAASYGTVLVLASLSVIGVTDVAAGHGAELIAGTGGATWIAHLFAELLARHVHDPEPLRRSEVLTTMLDGSPILAAPLLPAFALLLGRLDVLGDDRARTMAIIVAILQLLLVAAFVGRVGAGRSGASWTFSIVTVLLGVAVVTVTVILGH